MSVLCLVQDVMVPRLGCHSRGGEVGKPWRDLLCQYAWGQMKGRPRQRTDRALAPLPSQGPPFLLTPPFRTRVLLCVWGPAFLSCLFRLLCELFLVLSYMLSSEGSAQAFFLLPLAYFTPHFPRLTSTSLFCPSKGPPFPVSGPLHLLLTLRV